jgi:hypothetical protein
MKTRARRSPRKWGLAKKTWRSVFIQLALIVFLLVFSILSRQFSVEKVHAMELSQTIQVKEEQVKKIAEDKTLTEKQKDEEIAKLLKDIDGLKKEIEGLKKQLQAKANNPNMFQKLALIRKTFPEDPITAVAVFMGESGLNPQAKGWNCWYGQISTSCKETDRGRAWSVDCGLTQLNFSGQECPPESFNPEWNLQQARNKYNKRSWSPWSAFVRGSYLKHMDKARTLLAENY